MFTPKPPTKDYKFLYETLLNSYKEVVKQHQTLGEYIKKQKVKEEMK